MKVTNFVVIQVVNTVNSKEWFMNNQEYKSKIKFYFPVRSALKKNLDAFRKLGEEFMELRQEIESSENNKDVELKQLINASNEVDLVTYSQDDLDYYLQLNGEFMTEADVQILELFVEK